MPRKKKAKTSSRDRLKKIPFSMYLEPQQAKALRALSAKTGVPQQRYIREGIDYVLKGGRRVPDVLGMATELETDDLAEALDLAE